MGIFKTNWAENDTGHVNVHNAIANAFNNNHFNVLWFGAMGDGVTDDTVAIAAAIAAIPSQGGVLFFPPGVYLTSGGFSLPNPTTVQGCGMAGVHGNNNAITKIVCNHATNSLFTVSGVVARFRDLLLQNTSETTPSAGAGITCYHATQYQKVDFRDISVDRFYIDIDVQSGAHWTMDGCMLFEPVKYALKIADNVNPDAGDWCLSNSFFYAGIAADAAIRIESSGGGKIVNCKINDWNSLKFTHGIDMVPSAGIGTVILHISNSSIENVSGNGFNAVINGCRWRSIVLMGNEFGLWDNTTGHAIHMEADDIANTNGVIINGNVFIGGTGSGVAAVDLDTINNVQVQSNTFQNHNALVSQANCTNVVVQAA